MINYKDQAQRLVENGYHIVPIAAGTKAPKVKNWVTKTFTPADIVAGVGVKCGIGDYPISAIDIDVTATDIAQKVVAFCHDTIGYTVERVGQSPKILLPYLASEAGWKKQTSKKYGDDNYQIEVLGKGQQFVSYAIHPKTKQPYDYTDFLGGLVSVQAKDLPTVTQEQIQAVIGYFEGLCNDKGLPAHNGQTSQSKDTNAPTDNVAGNFMKDEPLGFSLGKIRHYLQFIEPHDYNTWLKVGAMLHHEFKGGHDGLDLWNDWSETAPNYAGYDDMAGKWATFNNGKDKPVTVASLIHMAKQHTEYESYTADPVELIEVIQQLATLEESYYQIQRVQKAKYLGLTPASLDKAVYAERKKLDSSTAPKIVDDVEPYGEAVNGDELAGEIYQLINNHIACDGNIPAVVTLWIFFTWCIDVSHFAPIAWINAPEKRCGKTTLAGLMGRMSKRPLLASNMSVATFFRTVDKFTPTLIIDEADTFIKKDEDLRGAINAGFSRDNCYFWRCVGDNLEPTPFNVFGAKVISGIGKLPSTIVDRSIPLTLRRAMPEEKKQRLHELPQPVTDLVKAKLARWANDNMESVRTQTPPIPESIYNRAFDNWEILFKIATALGGNWLDRVTLASLAITESEPVEPSLNEQLLVDIQTLFERHKLERISSKDLLAGLTGGLGEDFGEHEPMIWETYNHGKPISDRQIAKRLKDFGIKSKQARFDDKNLMGYAKKDFADAFKRYLP